MRALTKALVGVTSAVGIAAGGLATAGTANAAATQTEQRTASTEVAPLAVNNLGLSRAEARNVQRFLAKHWEYNGTIDGYLGTNSWKAFQRLLAKHHGYKDGIDGIVDPNTIKAVQRLMQKNGYYTGPINGVANSGTKAALKLWSTKL